ncbi:hypothetical protein [Nostoc sp.]
MSYRLPLVSPFKRSSDACSRLRQGRTAVGVPAALDFSHSL